MEFNENLKSFLDNIRLLAKTETVIGEQFTLGEYSVVPIIKIGIGLGGGYGKGDGNDKGKGEGGGLGGGVSVEPIAFLVVKDGEISMLNIGKSKLPEGLFDKIPDLIEKIASMKKKDKKKSEEE